MLSPAPFCFFHALYSISFVQLAAVFQPLLLLSPVYRKNPALTRKMFRFLFCRRKYGILIIQILSCYQLNQIALRSIMEPFNTPLKIRRSPCPTGQCSAPWRASRMPLPPPDGRARRGLYRQRDGVQPGTGVWRPQTVSLLKAEPNGAPTACRSLARCPRSWGRPLPPWSSTRRFSGHQHGLSGPQDRLGRGGQQADA